MPSPRRELRSIRQEWNNRHLAHLLTGIDWCFMGSEGWGNLDEMADEKLLATVEDMVCCWRANQHLMTPEHVGLNDLGEAPWFVQYADNPQRLIDEARADRAYMQEQRRRGGYFPRREMNDYTSVPPAPATAATN